MTAITHHIRRSAPVEAAARVTKSALRFYGQQTAGSRNAPDFLIIGAKRGGTTSLWEYLAEHPGLLPQFPARRAKGTYFLTDHFDMGADWWLSHFPTTRVRDAAERRLGFRPVTGEATPYYLFHPLAPARAAALAPQTVAIAVLRNPIDRAFSHWKERRRHTEDLEFADALAAEAERTEGEHERIRSDASYVSFAHRHQTYVAQSEYGPMLERWSASFPRDQLLVWTAEEFYADPQSVVDAITSRLGLPQRELKDPTPRNAAPSKGLDPAIRAELATRLQPTIEAVDTFLGRPTGWT